MKDPWNRTGLSYSELCNQSTLVKNFKDLPKEPELGQKCHYLNQFTGCTYIFVEWQGLLGWIWLADL